MSGTPTLATLGVDRTVTPAALCVVSGGVVFATLGIYTTAGVWVPAGALLPSNNLSDVTSAATARSNIGAAPASAVLTRGQIVALALGSPF